jgi:DNA-binding CsgD family transcriptional regulator
MPFVELSSFLPGIIRHCLGESDETSYMVLRTMIARYRNGWLGLRERIGARVPGSDLSLLEYSVATLAVYGWTNREVSWFLGIAENTVKHYLSNAYRKLEVKNRGELVAKFRPKR